MLIGSRVIPQLLADLHDTVLAARHLCDVLRAAQPIDQLVQRVDRKLRQQELELLVEALPKLPQRLNHFLPRFKVVADLQSLVDDGVQNST
jgi:hypothetical protein